MRERVAKRAADWNVGGEPTLRRDPCSITTGSDLLDLQRTAGNAAVVDMLGIDQGPAPNGRSRLQVGAVDDPTEASADRMADRALRRVSGRSLNAAAFRDEGGLDCCGANVDHGLHRSDVIHRHASWEHRMLSDVSPENLKIVVEGRDALRDGAASQSAATAAAGATALQVQGKKMKDAFHVLDQEIKNLLWLRDCDAWLMSSSESVAKAMAKKGVPDAPDVTLVPIALHDARWAIVTYGEINTLADYLGSSDEIGQIDADNLRNIIRGIRERELRGFVEIRKQVRGQEAKQTEVDDPSFAGAIGDTGARWDIPGVITGSERAEVALMGSGSGSKQAIGGKAETSYSAGLARNACHFAPYSWHAWADHHTRAADLAKDAHRLRSDADLKDLVDDGAAATALRKQADEKEREALVLNGFGDHFLQDSFASGHLINKTLIMQWFVKWLDANPWDRDMADDETWRCVQAAAYGQDEAVTGRSLYQSPVTTRSNDPQSVENMPSDTTTWKDRFDALGLQIPASLRDPMSPPALLFRSWQEGIKAAWDLIPDAAAVAAFMSAVPTMSLAELRRLPHGETSGTNVEQAVRALIGDGVVYRESRSRLLVDESLAGDKSQIGRARSSSPPALQDEDTFTLRDEYIPTRRQAATVDPPTRPREEMSDADDARVAASREASRTAQDDKLKAVAAGDFYTFLNRSYLQYATNQLHNEFCKNGLKVANDDVGPLMTVYGDNAMLDKGAAEGVAYSAATARLSLAAIKQWAAEGKVDADKTVESIARRFPHYVEAEVDGRPRRLSIERWHDEGGPLQQHCNRTLFPTIARRRNVASSAAGGGLPFTDEELSTKVTKDVDVHQGEAF